MLSFARPAFVDRAATVRDLANAVELWRLWFIKDRSANIPSSRAGFIRLEAQVYGFPVFERDAIAHAAMAACHSIGTVVEVLPETSADTLSFATTWIDSDTTDVTDYAEGGLWQALLSTTAVKGLCLILTVLCRAGRDTSRTATAFGGDLCFFGVCRGPDQFFIKTIWNPSRQKRIGPIDRMVTTPFEQNFPAALEFFSRQVSYMKEGVNKVVVGPELQKIVGRAPLTVEEAAAIARRRMGPKSGKALFRTAQADRTVGHFLGVFFDFHGGRGPFTFIRRLVVSLAITAGAIALAEVVSPVQAKVVLYLLASVALAVAGRVIFVKVRRIVRFRQSLNRAISKVYEREAERQLATFDEYGEDPHPNRYMAELKALGATHCFDYTVSDMPNGTRACSQCFVVDNQTRISVGLMRATGKLRYFPARPVLAMTTRFRDGLRLMTSGTIENAYKTPVVPNVLVRYVVGGDDPQELLNRHREVVRRLVNEGRVVIPPATDPATVFAEMKADHDQVRKYRQGKTIYTWGDAIRKGFEMPRKDYFEPGWPRRSETE